MVPEAPTAKKFVGLPLSVVGPVDVGRLMREVEAIDNLVMQQTLQKIELQLPKTSKLMDELIELNHLNMLDKAERERALQFLRAVHDKAPTIHISFGADPSPIFTDKLMTWLRENIHPLVLLTIGLQPNIGAGCMVRTTNKYFDFSLYKHFSKNRELLMTELRKVATEPAVTVPTESGPPIPAAPASSVPPAPAPPAVAAAPAAVATDRPAAPPAVALPTRSEAAAPAPAGVAS